MSCTEDEKTGWNEVKSDNAPSARYDSCSFYQNSIKSFFVIGGLTQDTRLNDIWKFDTNTNSWREVPTPSGVSLKDAGRMNYCVFDQDTDSLYLYGINEGGNASPSRILKYYVNSNKIEELASSNVPGTSRGHSLLLLKNGLPEPSLVIFGGEDGGSNKNNDVRVFSLISKEFEVLEVNGLKPRARMLHTAVISDDNKMIIVGGKSNSGNSNDIWSFDFTTKTWTEVSLNNENIQTYFTSNTYDEESNSIYLFGGQKSDSSEFSSDLLKYSIEDDDWKELNSDSKPGELSGSALILTPENNLYIFGGNSINSKNETIPNNKLWKNNLK